MYLLDLVTLENPDRGAAKRFKFLGYARGCGEDLSAFQLQDLDLCLMSSVI